MENQTKAELLLEQLKALRGQKQPLKASKQTTEESSTDLSSTTKNSWLKARKQPPQLTSEEQELIEKELAKVDEEPARRGRPVKAEDLPEPENELPIPEAQNKEVDAKLEAVSETIKEQTDIIKELWHWHLDFEKQNAIRISKEAVLTESLKDAMLEHLNNIFMRFEEINNLYIDFKAKKEALKGWLEEHQYATDKQKFELVAEVLGSADVSLAGIDLSINKIIKPSLTSFQENMIKIMFKSYMDN